MKQKLFALFLAVIMMFSLVACTDSVVDSNTGTDTGSQSVLGTTGGDESDASLSQSAGLTDSVTEELSNETDGESGDNTSSEEDPDEGYGFEDYVNPDFSSDKNSNTSSKHTSSKNTSSTTDRTSSKTSSTSKKNTSSSTKTTSSSTKTTSSSTKTTSSSTKTSTSTSTTTSSSSSSGSTSSPNVPVYDPSIEHKVILTDDTSSYGIIVLDLNLVNEQWTKLDWKKSGNPQPYWKYSGGRAYCGVKYRETSSGEKFVIATESSGYVDIINFTTGRKVKTLSDDWWYTDNTDDDSLYNAHEAEMLPNGDIIVACSGYAESGWNYENGGLRYYKRSGNNWTLQSYLTLPFAHAAVWDPSENCLWTVAFDGVVAVDVNTSTGTMSKNTSKSYSRSGFSGHDMVPAYGMDGCFWVSDNSSVYLFDSAKKTLTRSSYYSVSQVKGIAYFADGTMITTPAYQSQNPQWYATSLYVYITKASNDYVPVLQKVPTTAGIYKVHTFTKNYE